MRRPTLVVLALLALTLASCAQPAADPEPFTVPTEQSAAPTGPPEITQSAAEDELYGPRVELPGGLLQKELGKVAQWGGPDDTDPKTWGIRVVLDEIRVDPPCDEFMPEPERGHRLVLSLRVETSEMYDAMYDDGPHWYRWSVTGPDGVSEAAGSTGALCTPANDLPFELRPSAKYRGEVVVDTRYDSGQLVLDNVFAWKFPPTAGA